MVIEMKIEMCIPERVVDEQQVDANVTQRELANLLDYDVSEGMKCTGDQEDNMEYEIEGIVGCKRSSSQCVEMEH